MFDLHTHSIFSDGELIPSELVQRAIAAGYRALAITDHGDYSNLDLIVPRIVKVCEKLSLACDMAIIPGIELTHVLPVHISELAEEARALGARLIVVHGETIVEPVPPGTNLAALKSSIDILAHPGLITEEEAQLAFQRNIYLEVTTRRGHSLTNGHVVRMARQYNAPLVMNTDAHAPEDLFSRNMAEKIAYGVGLSETEVSSMFENSKRIVQKVTA